MEELPTRYIRREGSLYLIKIKFIFYLIKFTFLSRLGECPLLSLLHKFSIIQGGLIYVQKIDGAINSFSFSLTGADSGILLSTGNVSEQQPLPFGQAGGR